MKGINIVWLPHARNPVYAGVRLRCLIPQAILRAQGMAVQIGDAQTDLRGADIVVTQAKWLLDAHLPDVLDARMHRLLAAKESGSRLVLDSFDNYFLNESRDPQRDALLEAYRSCLGNFDWFTVSSPGLVPYLRQVLPIGAPITVVGDPLEDAASHCIYESALQRMNPRRWLHGLRAQFDRWHVRFRRNQERRLMWFGSHGSKYASGGMGQLTRILPILQDIASRVPLHLTVVSSSRGAFNEVLGSYRFDMSYREWDRLHFVPLLREQDLVLLPISINPFTASKSNNRLLLPLSQGVPVMTDALPDYLPWSAYCAIDEWKRLEDHIRDPSDLKHRAAGASARLRDEYCADAIVKQWRTTLTAVAELHSQV